MAYANYDFYKKNYYGEVLTEKNFNRYAEIASDWLDTVTFKRLVSGLPTDEYSAKRAMKCVCRLAETFCQLDKAQENATSSMSGISASGENIDNTRTIKAVSSGSESVTYMTPAEQAAGAKEWSVVYAAAGDSVKRDELLYKIAKEYLSGIQDSSGIPLLYAGM